MRSLEESEAALRILIVDDDEMLRTVCSGMLSVMQHDPVAVASGTDAIKRLVTDRERFDLILIDEAMPDMNGRETLSRLSAAGVKIPVIVCSGKSTTVDQSSAPPEYRPVATLAKPFTMAQLTSVLKLAST